MTKQLDTDLRICMQDGQWRSLADLKRDLHCMRKRREQPSGLRRFLFLLVPLALGPTQASILARLAALEESEEAVQYRVSGEGALPYEWRLAAS